MSEMIILELLKIAYVCSFVFGATIIIFVIGSVIELIILYVKYPEDSVYRLKIQRDITLYLKSKNFKEKNK